MLSHRLALEKWDDYQGIWHIDKQIGGIRICQSTGESDLQKAEEYLAKLIDEMQDACIYGIRICPDV